MPSQSQRIVTVPLRPHYPLDASVVTSYLDARPPVSRSNMLEAGPLPVVQIPGSLGGAHMAVVSEDFYFGGNTL